MELVLPQNMLEKEQYLALPSLQKEEYIDNILKEVLKLNTLGITVSQIDKETYFGHSTIWHHMELLAAKAECLKMERGDTDVYHSNRVLAVFEELELKDSRLQFRYAIDIVENMFGQFIRVQRHMDSRSKAHVVRSGILIPHSVADDLINAIAKLNNKSE